MTFLFSFRFLFHIIYYLVPCCVHTKNRPDGHSPDTSSSTSKWPFKQGVLLHVNNKMHGLNNGTIPMTATQFKTTSVAKAGHRFMNNKRNRNKVYARLEKLRDLLGFGDQDSMPFGVYRGSGGGKGFPSTFFCVCRCL